MPPRKTFKQTVADNRPPQVSAAELEHLLSKARSLVGQLSSVVKDITKSIVAGERALRDFRQTTLPMDLAAKRPRKKRAPKTDAVPS